MNAATLAAYSVVAVYSAIAVYVLAFIAFALDLSKRSQIALGAANAQAVASPSRAASGGTKAANAGSGTATAVLDRAVVDRAAPPAVPGAPVANSGVRGLSSRFQRTGYALVIIGWVVHLTALVLRGLAAGRVPWANLYEFAMTGTAIIVGVFIVIQLWRDLRFLGAYITGIVVLLLGLASVNFYVAVTPLPPALQSAWLVIHVFVATLGTGFFAVGGGLSIAQLLQTRREAGGFGRLRLLNTFPAAQTLENMAYRVIVVGFAFWTFTLMAGAIWAERAWGRYWGWDTKEVWTFIIWVTFAGYIHARATQGWRGSRSAWLAIIGFTAVMFNFTVVNLFFKGLHAYSGL
ncbi:c-type cytochrome biogenesis protein CcsB [Lysinimonas soli]|uniref:C-type cytochrome biogenesis protein CcsB n=1 Tax=Lysinimonas soli TaxID=1074233 RepID=A0ABW0NTE4_9MICO